MKKAPSFDVLLRKPNKTEIEQVLIQCIVSLSPTPNCQHLTPHEIYDLQVKAAREIRY